MRASEQMVNDALDWWEDQPNSTEHSKTSVLEAILEAIESNSKVLDLFSNLYFVEFSSLEPFLFV